MRGYFPCQLQDGSTHVIGPTGQIVKTISSTSDMTARWRLATREADRLNQARAAKAEVARNRASVVLAIMFVLAVAAVLVAVAWGPGS